MPSLLVALGAVALLLIVAGCGSQKTVSPAAISAAGPAATPAAVKVVFAATPPGGVAALPLWKPGPDLLPRLGPVVLLPVGSAGAVYTLRSPKGFLQQEIAHNADAPAFQFHPAEKAGPTLLVSIRQVPTGARTPRVQAVLVEELVRRLHGLPANTLTLGKAELGRSPDGWEWARIRFQTVSETTRNDSNSVLYAAVDTLRRRLIVVTISGAGKESLPLMEASALTFRVNPASRP